MNRHPEDETSPLLSCAAIALLAVATACSSDDTAGGGGKDGGADLGGAASSAGGGTNGGAASSAGGAATNGGAGAGGARNGGGTPSGGGRSNAGGGASGGAASNGGADPGDGGAASSDGGRDGAGGASSPPGWTLVWSDEFDDPAGTPVDGSKWNLVDKGDGFGNNELQYYTNRTDNAATDGNGFLVITAKKEDYMGRQYTSARLESNGKFERTFGRIEARLQVPRGQGIWPAFWMLGTDIGSAGWPNCGEIDVMENIGREPSTVHGSLHGPGYSGGNPLGAAYELANGEKFADALHVFAVEWEEDVIRFYVDENLYETRTPDDVPGGGRWVYDHPFFLLLNVAVGGQWPGSPDGTTTFPQTMKVDYVRVYGR